MSFKLENCPTTRGSLVYRFGHGCETTAVRPRSSEGETPPERLSADWQLPDCRTPFSRFTTQVIVHDLFLKVSRDTNSLGRRLPFPHELPTNCATQPTTERSATPSTTSCSTAAIIAGLSTGPNDRMEGFGQVLMLNEIFAC